MDRKYSCIVIDDDMIYTELMNKLISQIDYLDLVGAYNSPMDALLEIEKNGTPDLLFLDVQMPHIDAFTTIEALDPKPKIIVVSSHWQFEDKLLEAGASKFIQKPIRNSQHLDEIIQEVITEKV